jgi:tRNA(Ile)-lysidine synthase
MLDEFLQFIRRQKLCRKNDRVLLAASGGVDSMVMIDLFRNGNYQIGIGHCNFQLRGAAADGDELLVINAAKTYNIPFHVKKFDTIEYSKKHGISIQMAARRLRYDWLEEIRECHGYAAISTAHHLNDNIETLLFNLFRGTGLRGLTGIPVRKGRVIRPLLFASKDQIVKYAALRKISYREDQSNLETKYKRNLIRREIFPLIEKINPGFTKTIISTLNRLIETQKIIDYWLNHSEDQFIHHKGDHVYLKRSYFQDIGSPVLLHEVLRKWNFDYDQSVNILTRSKGSGALYFSETHVLNIDRQYMVVSPNLQKDDSLISWSSEDEELNSDFGKFRKEIIPAVKLHKTSDPNIEFFDLTKLKFPLILRFWKDGDWFIPLGMKGKKKLSDFMIDKKIPVNLKKRIPVILSGESIIWVVGYRIDERFKYTPESSQLVKITYMPGHDQSF